MPAVISLPPEIDMGLHRKLKGEESREPFVYQDSEGWWTIGCGRLVDKRKGGGLLEDEIDYLLNNDLEKVYRQVVGRFPWVLGMEPARQGVLYEMAFQMGIGGLATFVNTLKAMQQGEYKIAGELMLKSKWAAQTPERAKRLSDQMIFGAWIWKPGF